MTFRILLLPALFLLLTNGHAANYVVVNNSNSGPGSLRQAIVDANAGGGGNITFSNVSGTIALQSDLPALTANITISGPGSAALTISIPGEVSAVLTNSAANTAALTGLTISASLDNYGTFTLDDVIVGNQFNPGHAGLYNSGTMTLSRCTFTGNRVPNGNADSIENDGAINLDHCSITNNGGGDGSIYNTGSLTMDNSIVVAHYYFTSSSGGIVNDGGIVVLRNCSISNNVSVEGGGIWNAGSLAVTNCVINSNRSVYSDPPTPGGGLYNFGYAILQNTTVSGNSAMGQGGGIWNDGSLRLLNCTIASNTASMGYQQPGSGGGVWNSTSDRTLFQSRNSIIAGNKSVTTNQTLVADDIHGNLDSFGHNIILSGNGWTGFDNTDLIGVDPLLGPLQDNGGPTLTHALKQGSPAINAVDPTGAPVDDQRGVPRPQGPGIDIGAFEFVYFTNAVFAHVEVQSSTNVSLKAFGSPFTSYMLQVSQDFVTWSNVTTVTSQSNGVLQLTGPITSPKGFFRLRSQTP
jgi:hypothetical protein